MPELTVGNRRWEVPTGASLLDALNRNGVAVPSSCHAGHCHTCRVRCVAGQPDDQRPDALPAHERAMGWRLACQCRMVGDLEVVPYNPKLDGVEARISEVSWHGDLVLRLRVVPHHAVRYQAGQHVVLWTEDGVARPYSIASLPQEAPWLEFHIQCSRPGAFADRARHFKEGDCLRLGEVLGGPLHYDLAWETRPLWLVGSGTGLAPLWAVLRFALSHHHCGPIHVVHMAGEGSHYLSTELNALAALHPNLQVDLRDAGAQLTDLRPARQTIALACGAPAMVQAVSRRLFMAGLPRNQLFTDTFEKNLG